MPRYLMRMEYDGTPFRGWQRQENGVSVQGSIESAIRAFSGEQVTVFGAGRTDAGVHALGQHAHAELVGDWPVERVRMAINAKLSGLPIAILDVRRVADDFHARFDACQRAYLYRIATRRAPPALDRDRVWHHPQPLDHEIMHEAASRLIGKHDFSSFRASQCQATSPVKTMQRITVLRRRDEIELHFQAPSFLHNQVRAITGTLALIGAKKHPISAIIEILQARDRTKAGPNAPASGLYLANVAYPPHKLS